MSRFSAPIPVVASHQSRTTAPRAPAPTRRPVIRGGAIRSANRAGFVSDDIYFGADVASAGYTLISTRLFFAAFSGSAGSNGRSQPMPAAEN